jgi:3-deoxy-D-manno-octulosonic-acid transferase
MAPAALWVYRGLLTASMPVLAPYLLLRARRRGGHLRLGQRLGFKLQPLPPRGVWVQAVSVGEVAVARPLLAELRRRFPALPLLLSSTTSTGLSVASGQQLADVVMPFPLDLPGPTSRLLAAARPRLVVLVETELWPELLAQCGRRAVPVVLVNARVSERSFRRYRAFASLLPALLRPVSLVLAQTEADAARFAAMGVAEERLTVVGNIKFDASPPGPPPQVAPAIRKLAGDRQIVVAGSTVAGEEGPVVDAWLSLPAERRPFLILAPRHPERAAEALEIASEKGAVLVRRTLVDASAPTCDGVVLDTVGELASLYSLAQVAFVGGSLVAGGGHNPIEPARVGVPILTGPHVKNFATVYQELIRAGAACVVGEQAHLTTSLDAWLADPQSARRAGEAGRALLDRHAGATRQVVRALEPFIS